MTPSSSGSSMTGLLKVDCLLLGTVPFRLERCFSQVYDVCVDCVIHY